VPGERDGAAMDDKREVILEYHQVGNSVRVAAVDPDTLTEVSAQADRDPQARICARKATEPGLTAHNSRHSTPAILCARPGASYDPALRAIAIPLTTAW